MATSNLTSKTGYLNAKKIVDSVANNTSNMYVYIGRPQPWSTTSDDPPNILNTLEEEYDVWHDMTALKRVSDRDITLGFKRIDWTSSVVYDEYSDDVDLSDKNFYVFTDENKVYKCISNNNSAQSTTKPTHTTTNIVETIDGYKWKYMFTISDSLFRKFAFGDYLPISSDEDVISEAVVGSIDHLKLIDGGTGYPINATLGSESSPELPIYVLGDGNETATATCNIIASGGVIQSIQNITDQGSGYPISQEGTIPVMFRQVGTTGAVETGFGIATTGVGGQIIQVQLVLSGAGYTTGEVTIVQSSCYGYAETNSSGDVINVEISIARNGSRFRRARSIVVANSFTEADIKPIISPFRGHGFSPERELFGKYVIINLNFAYNEGEGDFTIENDFRRIGLIENPYAYGTETVATAGTLNAKRTLELTNISGSFSEDDAIYGQTSGAIGFYVDKISTDHLRYIKDDTLSNNVDFVEGEQITSSSGASATVSSITNPEVEPYSGDLSFINNTIAVDRTSNQIETIALVLEY